MYPMGKIVIDIVYPVGHNVLTETVNPEGKMMKMYERVMHKRTGVVGIVVREPYESGGLLKMRVLINKIAHRELVKDWMVIERDEA